MNSERSIRGFHTSLRFGHNLKIELAGVRYKPEVDVMEQFDFAGYVIACDAERTRTAYGLTDSGAHDCSCGHCRNFIPVRDSQYPPRFLELLDQLGITPHKEAEVYEMGEGKRRETRAYGGWYHFMGTIAKDPGTEIRIPGRNNGAGDWYISFHTGTGLALTPLKGLPLVQLEFSAELPWVLSEDP
jgi:hypothetical protein